MNHLQIPVSAGTLAVTWNGQGLLTRLDWYDTPPGSASTQGWSALSSTHIPPVLGGLLERMQSYFERGEPLGSLPWEVFETRGWTDFQQRIYRAAASIPHGETRSYSWVARKVGQVAATRAVGQALRRNPMPILIPCHRVVASNNALGGFMGIQDPDQPELKFKRWLIELENGYLNPVFSFLAATPRFNSSPQALIHAG